ncbi:DDE-type integrase/transposase/recombinase [Mesorhizobium sangaii]|uniref:DDE-type integrase/transposase/recombinase n=1 Tax=Mesorhizobium sangaii TaxID=505389 RepID=UPI003CCD2E59
MLKPSSLPLRSPVSLRYVNSLLRRDLVFHQCECPRGRCRRSVLAGWRRDEWTPGRSAHRHRIPAETISHAFGSTIASLQSAPVAEMLLERGIAISLRDDAASGPGFAWRLHRKTPSRSDIWHLDERVESTAGKRHWQWTAVDQDGNVLDEIVHVRRNAKAPKRLLPRC